jgi:hypothetical protein
VATTATEAQLVQAALAKRVELKSRRFEIEVVRHSARCFLYLDQRMILANRDPIRQPDHGYDQERAAAEGRWRWVEVGPGELQGEFEIIPEGGSMAARNVPQDQQTAVQMMQLFGGRAEVNQGRLLEKCLRLFGVNDSAAWMEKGDPPVPPGVFKVLEQMGFDPNAMQFAMRRAQEMDPRTTPLEQQGPNADQVGAMMGDGQAVAA